jgi:RING finger protein 113A
MFRKPKRKVKESLRRKEETNDNNINNPEADDSIESSNGVNNNDGEEQKTTDLLSEARKRIKTTTATSTNSALIASTAGAAEAQKKSGIMHTFDTSNSSKPDTANADLAVSRAEHHAPDKQTDGVAAKGEDGIFRNQQLNKFYAGPIRAAQHVRVTTRFDYQPDICKDYKDTGFCGFGDTCIYLHDRGDTMSGWQLEQQYEEEQKLKKDKQEKELQDFVDKHAGSGGGNGKPQGEKPVVAEDGLPFACYLCREHFKDPVVSNCMHYFCQDCIMQHVRNTSESCPICNKDMHGVFNEPRLLLAKKRRALGSKDAKAENSWEEYYKIVSGQGTGEA